MKKAPCFGIAMMRERDQTMKRQKVRNCRGSVTVELALLMPLIFGTLMLLIYIGFYLYNRETIETIACMGLHKGLQMEHEGRAAVQKEVEDYVQSCLQERLILSPTVTQQVQVSLTSVCVVIEMEQEFPFSGALRILSGQQSFRAKVKKKGRRMDPAAVIWMGG